MVLQMTYQAQNILEPDCALVYGLAMGMVCQEWLHGDYDYHQYRRLDGGKPWEAKRFLQVGRNLLNFVRLALSQDSQW